jgi:phosphoribosylformylglycinamidine synthase
LKIAVVRTPGSNCDQDAFFALQDSLGVEARYVWHEETSLQGFDGILIPGGFTYGDYLRGGAIAARAPVIDEVRRFAADGRPVLGICNGFQILTEAGILPGALVRNAERRFLCMNARIKAVDCKSPWTRDCDGVLSIPIAHNEGRYVADDEDVRRLEGEGLVAFVYCDANGGPAEAPNGSTHSIAGILNSGRNVLGMMPHPERASSPILGGDDGLRILRGFSAANLV